MDLKLYCRRFFFPFLEEETLIVATVLPFKSLILVTLLAEFLPPINILMLSSSLMQAFLISALSVNPFTLINCFDKY